MTGVPRYEESTRCTARKSIDVPGNRRRHEITRRLRVFLLRMKYDIVIPFSEQLNKVENPALVKRAHTATRRCFSYRAHRIPEYHCRAFFSRSLRVTAVSFSLSLTLSPFFFSPVLRRPPIETGVILVNLDAVCAADAQM